MGYALFLGCLCIAFAPPFAVFTIVLSNNPRLVILTIGSSFFWLTSILFASTWWFMIPPLKESFGWVTFWSVLFQELFRFIFLKLYMKAEKGLASNTSRTAQLTTHPDHFMAALAFGIGSGMTQSLIMYVSILWSGLGPGAYFTPACPSISVYLLGALVSLAFVILHVFWYVIGFDGFRELSNSKNKKWPLIKIGIVVGSHLIASFLTLLNQSGGSCVASLILLYFLLFIMAGITWLVIMTNPGLIRRRNMAT